MHYVYLSSDVDVWILTERGVLEQIQHLHKTGYGKIFHFNVLRIKYTKITLG